MATKLRGRVQEVWFTPSGEVVILGAPDTDGDEMAHNCDALGCGQDHVLWRGRIATHNAAESEG